MTSAPFPFNLKELKALSQLDRKLVDLTQGKRDFECPDINERLKGKRYVANEMERAFTQRAQSIAMSSFLRYTLVGGFIGYALTMSRPQMRVISIAGGTVVGSTFGVSKASVGIMRHQLALKDSPIAMESRYQLWKIDPNHKWLTDYQNDTQRWNKMQYYRSSDIKSTNYDNNNINNNNNNFNNNQYESYNKMDNDYKKMDNEEFEEIQSQKREKFYQNRKRLGDNDYSANQSSNDHLFDYERENRAKDQFKRNRQRQRQNNDDFFHGFDQNTNNNMNDDGKSSTMVWG